MLPTDGNIIIGTALDASGIKKGTKDVKKGLKDVKGAFQELVPQVNLSKLATLGFATAAAAGVKKFIDVMNECAATYRVQVKAEKQLAAAAQNNPYLDKESIANLKAFAGELQGVSEIGDEVSIGLMAQLATAGRTEDEIKKIMSTATDMAASGMMSIDSAVKNLNKSFSGLAGELGEVVPELKGLSVEQMQQGAAVDLIAGKVKGIARQSADINVQMANAIGDLKENIGEGWEEALEPMKRAFLGVITEINSKAAKNKAFKEQAASEVLDIDSFSAEFEKHIEKFGKNTAIRLNQQIAELSNNGADKELIKSSILPMLEDIAKQENVQVAVVARALQTYKGLTPILKEITDEIEERIQKEHEEKALLEKQRLDAEKAAKDKKRRQEEQKAAEAAKNQKAEELLKIYNDTIAKKEQELALQAQLSGEPIDELTYAQEMLNTRTQAYIALMQNGEGIISGNAAREIAEREKIAALMDTVIQKTKEKKDAQDAVNEALEITKKKLEEIEKEKLIPKSDLVQKQLDAVKEAGEKIKLMSDKEIEVMTDGKKTKEQLLDDLAKTEERLEKEKVEAVKNAAHEKVQATAKEIADRLQIISDFANQANQIASDISTFATNMINTERDLKLAALKEENLSSEEYAEKEKEIRKEAAKEQYKADMFKWTASLLSATANIALGITKALSEGGPYAGPILAAMMGIAGGIQMASLIAAKPRPPSFATGGIVGGNSYSGDNVQANVNSGEMILNAAQQRALWETANGRGGKGGTTIIIHNSASNQVRAAAKVDKGQIEVMINAIVNRRLADGTYDAGLAAVEKRKAGERYI